MVFCYLPSWKPTWHDQRVRIRIDLLSSDPRAPASTAKPCAQATRMQGIRRGRVEKWWEVNLETMEDLVDILRRSEGKSAVVELVDEREPHPSVRVWLVEDHGSTK